MTNPQQHITPLQMAQCLTGTDNLDEVVKASMDQARIMGQGTLPTLTAAGVLSRLVDGGFRIDADGLDEDCFDEDIQLADKFLIRELAEKLTAALQKFNEYLAQYGYQAVWLDFGPDTEDRNEIFEQVYLLIEPVNPPKNGEVYIGQIWVRYVGSDDPENDGELFQWCRFQK